MKKEYLLLCILLFIIGSCSDDDNGNDNVLRLSKSSCTFDGNRNYEIIEINNGSGIYTVQTSESKVATAEVKGNQLCIFGHEWGDAIITITDANRNSAQVNVKVTIPIQSPVYLTYFAYLKKGTFIEFPYLFDVSKHELENSDETIAKVLIKDRKLHAEGLKQGLIELTVKEYGFYPVRGFDIQVVDVYDLRTGLEWLSIGQFYIRKITESDKHIFDIICGNGEYVIKSSDESIATTQIMPYTGEVDPYITRNPVTVKVNAKKLGNVVFTITDVESGNTIEAPFRFIE